MCAKIFMKPIYKPVLSHVALFVFVKKVPFNKRNILNFDTFWHTSTYIV